VLARLAHTAPQTTGLFLLLRDACSRRFLFENAVNNFWKGQGITFQQEIEFLPRHVTLAVAAIEPLFPTGAAT